MPTDGADDYVVATVRMLRSLFDELVQEAQATGTTASELLVHTWATRNDRGDNPGAPGMGGEEQEE